jgi:F0F1-type ATP synthase assembly protein I
VVLLIASQQSELHALVAVLVVGLVIGVFGHIIHSRPLIITSILMIGGVSAYFAFGFSHVT